MATHPRGPALGESPEPPRRRAGVDMALNRREALWRESRPLSGGRNGRGAQTKGIHSEERRLGSLCLRVAEHATTTHGLHRTMETVI